MGALAVKTKQLTKSQNERLKFRSQIGYYHTTFSIIYNNFPDELPKIIRLTYDQFECLVGLVGKNLVKLSIREPISPRERLVLTLRYLVSGVSINDLAITFDVATTTAKNIIKETMPAIWHKLK